MAHGRSGPDIVMTTRYAGASEIRAVSDHEENRTPDGSSAIDTVRSHLNEILHGPATQQKALDVMWEKGVKKPTQQAEEPYVQIVISASSSFFRSAGQGPGEWDPDKLKVWKDATMAWLQKEYGKDLAHVSLHLDEDTPHMHVLVVPTYEKKQGRKPSQRKKSGETYEEFQERLTEWKNSPETTRTAGRSSSEYWSKTWCRLEARKSYHQAVEHLGLGYGKDFVGENEDSPKRKVTGTWVREEAVRLADERAELLRQLSDLERREDIIENKMRLIKSMQNIIMRAVSTIRGTLGLVVGRDFAEDVKAINDKIDEIDAISAEDARPEAEDSPGF